MIGIPRTLCLLLISVVLLSFSGTRIPNEAFNVKKLEKSLMLIPKGSFGDLCNDCNSWTSTLSRSAKIDSFYMYQHEVSNGEYVYFLNDLKKTDTNTYKKMLPDTLVWRFIANYNEPYVIYYLHHPAYANYPVVGVSHEQATYYCKWFTQKYMSNPKRKYRNVAFDLPTVNQWYFVASGGVTYNLFPWKGPHMQNSKGEWLANFRIIPQQSIGKQTFDIRTPNGLYEKREFISADNNATILGYKNEVQFYTTPVVSFWPNDYGIYNMAGNVEEFVKEKGITKGGSWFDTGYYLQNLVEEKYDSTNQVSAARGFRFVMNVVK